MVWTGPGATGKPVVKFYKYLVASLVCTCMCVCVCISVCVCVCISVCVLYVCFCVLYVFDDFSFISECEHVLTDGQKTEKVASRLKSDDSLSVCLPGWTLSG